VGWPRGLNSLLRVKDPPRGAPLPILQLAEEIPPGLTSPGPGDERLLISSVSTRGALELIASCGSDSAVLPASSETWPAPGGKEASLAAPCLALSCLASPRLASPCLRWSFVREIFPARGKRGCGTYVAALNAAKLLKY
jgi:hypothetical protein